MPYIFFFKVHKYEKASQSLYCHVTLKQCEKVWNCDWNCGFVKTKKCLYYMSMHKQVVKEWAKMT